MRALASCSCGRPMMPMIEGHMMMPGWSQGAGRLCAWCDMPGAYTLEHEQMWAELEMLERGSWPNRVQDLLPQAEPPENQ